MASFNPVPSCSLSPSLPLPITCTYMYQQYEVPSKIRLESTQELERRLKMMALEKLKMEKQVAKLYSVSGRDALAVQCTLDGYTRAT